MSEKVIHFLRLILWGGVFFLVLGKPFLDNGLALAESKDSIAYKLAILQIRSDHQENEFLGKTNTPAPATIAEFQWILDTLKSRCLNPESAIADTIVESWTTANKFMNQAGQSISLLETARELLAYTRNTKVLGTPKVNFRMTSRYWLKQKLGDQIK